MAYSIVNKNNTGIYHFVCDTVNDIQSIVETCSQGSFCSIQSSGEIYTKTSEGWRLTAEQSRGKGIAAITAYYLVSNLASGITNTSEGWTQQAPLITSSAPYLWSHLFIEYEDGSTGTTTPVIIGGMFTSEFDKRLEAIEDSEVILTAYLEDGSRLSLKLYGTEVSQDETT